jgi:tape measure domain-containing protein
MAGDMTLAIRLRTDGAGRVTADIQGVGRGFDRLAGQARTATDATARTAQSLDRLRSNLANMAHLAAAAFSVREISQFAAQTFQAATALQSTQRALAAVAGSAQAGAAEYAFLVRAADALGLKLSSLTQSYTSLAAATKGTALEGAATRNLFLAVSEAATALGLSTEKTNQAFVALGQMAGKGTISMEELRGQLGEALPGALQILARSMGLTVGQLTDLVAKGEVGADRLAGFARVLHEEYGTAAVTASRDAARELSRFETEVERLKATFAGGWMASAAEALRAITTYLKDPAIADSVRAWGAALGEAIGYVVANKEAVLAVAGALAGAAIGSRVGGGLGAAVGAVVGGYGTYRLPDMLPGTQAEQRIKAINERLEELNRLSETAKKVQDELWATQYGEDPIARWTANPQQDAGIVKTLQSIRVEAESLRDELEVLQSPSQVVTKQMQGLWDAAGDKAASGKAVGSFRELAGSITDTEVKLAKLAKEFAAKKAAIENAAFDVDSGSSKRELEAALQKLQGWYDDERAAIEKSTTAHKARAAAQSESEKAAAKHADTITKTVDALKLEIITLQSGEKAAELYRWSMEGIDEPTQALLSSMYDTKVALEAQKKAIEEAQKAGSIYTTVMERAAERLTDAFGDFFAFVFSKGMDSFKDLADSIKNLFFRLLGDLAAAALANPIKVMLGISGSAGASLFGGVAQAGVGQIGVGGSTGVAQAVSGGMSFSNMASSIVSGIGSWLTSTSMGETVVQMVGMDTLPSMLSSGLGNLASVSNWALAGSGIIGSLLGNALFGDKGYGSIGSSLGGAGGAIVGSMIFPGIGTLIGGLLGGVGGGWLGSLFGDSAPDEEWFRMYGGPRQANDSWYAPLAERTGPFGTWGVSGWEDLAGSGVEFATKLMNTLAAADAQIAKVMTNTQKSGVQWSVSTYPWSALVGPWEKDDTATRDQQMAIAIQERYARIFDAVDATIAQSIRAAADTQQATEAAIQAATTKLAKLNYRTKLIDALEDWVTEVRDFGREFTETMPKTPAAPKTQKETLDAANTALSRLIGNYSASVKWLEKMRDLLPQVYATEVAYLTQIREIRSTLVSSTEAAKAQITQSTMSPEELSGYYEQRAKAVFARLKVATDPAAIGSLSAQVQQYILSAWQNLPKNLIDFKVLFRDLRTAFGDARLQIKESLLSPQQLSDYYTQRARGLYERLKLATDPSSIATLAGQIEQYVTQAWQALPKDLLDFRQIFRDIKSAFESSAESIKTALMAPQELYDYYKNRANRLVGTVATTTSVEQLQTLAGRINEDMMRAWQTLPEATQREKQAEFLAFIKEFEALVSNRLDVLSAGQQTPQEQAAQYLDLLTDAEETAKALLQAAQQQPEQAQKYLDMLDEVRVTAQSLLDAARESALDAAEVLRVQLKTVIDSNLSAAYTVEGTALALYSSSASLDGSITKLETALTRVTGTQVDATSQFSVATNLFASAVTTLNTAANKIAQAADSLSNVSIDLRGAYK